MLCLYSAAGGSGCSVTATAAAIVSSLTEPTLLVDLGGDAPAILGEGEPSQTPLSRPQPFAEWMTAPHVSPDELRRAERTITPTLQLLSAARPLDPLDPERAELLAAELAADSRQVIVDMGQRSDLGALTERAARNVLVTRACYVALRRAQRGVRPDGIILLRETARALNASDVGLCLQSEVIAELSVDPRVFRAVDAGVLLRRLPRSLRPLAQVLR